MLRSAEVVGEIDYMIETHPTTTKPDSTNLGIWLTRAQVAELLQVSTRTVREYERRGKLKPTRLNARTIRYSGGEIAMLLGNQTGANHATN